MAGIGLTWRTKSVEQSIADTDDPETKLRKDLTWWDLIVFGVSVVNRRGHLHNHGIDGRQHHRAIDLAVVHRRGDHLRFGGAVLRRIRFDRPCRR
jgi:hypothetical protein